MIKIFFFTPVIVESKKKGKSLFIKKLAQKELRQLLKRGAGLDLPVVFL
jgi:hypothetical protein